jgi:glycosyltransferase involved in cell wall biosynthesis
LHYLEGRLEHKIPNAVYLPIGVDLNKFTIPEDKKQNKEIAFVGELSNKKGLQLVLMAAQYLPDWNFNLLGSYPTDDMRLLVEQFNLVNVKVHRYVDDVNEFLSSSSYIINTSPREGNPVSVLEGMAAGLKPLVFNWAGASILYRNFGTWMSLEELKNKLINEPLHPDEYREFINRYYSFHDTYKDFEKLMKGNE